MTYASAHNKILLVRGWKPMELSADKMPVGRGEINESFNMHSIQLRKNDVLYFYTDGFPDQFGGPKGKKFKSSNLIKFLADISALPMNEQQILIKEKFETWKGNYEQLDDVCLIGITI
jgi:serine phosphatase RsbU (regulator of sigma subunit)